MQTQLFYEFGNFRLDPTAKILFCEDEPVSLTPKVFETLQVLIEDAGRLLEKDELMQRIWPDRFVEESNLTFNIKMLRRALKDDAHDPRFIETIPRRGYRFIAAVKTNAPGFAPEASLSDGGSAPVPLTNRRLLPAIVIGAIVVVGLAAIAAWLAKSRHVTATLSAPILSAPFKSAQFSMTGRVHAVISPDGKYVAYTGETQGKENIWLRQLETSENIQVVPPADYFYLGLVISPDGNSLYFVRQPQTGESPAALFKVMTFGGIPVKLAEKIEGLISVSPDDRQVSFVRCNYQDDDNCSLFTIGADGKDERKLLTRKRPSRIGANQFSPDGKSIAFAAGQSSNGGNDFRLLRLDLASGAESAISAKTFFNIKDLKWLPAGDGLLLTAKETLDGRLRIWLVSATTGEVRALTNDATDYETVSLDKAADKMVATHVSNGFHLYLAPPDDLKNAKSLSISRAYFAFAPDGKIIYSGTDGNIWTINREGGEQRQLTNNSFTNFSPQVSADGRFIFFASNRTGSNQVWRMNADGSSQIQLTKTAGGYPRFATRDGKWVYFESGLYQTLWRVGTAGGEEMQVLEGKVWDAALSPDGTLVAYYFQDKRIGDRIRIAVMSLENRSMVKNFNLIDDGVASLKIAWATDNKSFDYVTESGPKHSLWRQSLDTDTPHLLGDFGTEEVADFGLSPDGRNFAFIRGKWVHDAVLIEGLK